MRLSHGRSLLVLAAAAAAVVSLRHSSPLQRVARGQLIEFVRPRSVIDAVSARARAQRKQLCSTHNEISLSLSPCAAYRACEQTLADFRETNGLFKWVIARRLVYQCVPLLLLTR